MSGVLLICPRYVYLLGLFFHLLPIPSPIPPPPSPPPPSLHPPHPPTPPPPVSFFELMYGILCNCCGPSPRVATCHNLCPVRLTESRVILHVVASHRRCSISFTALSTLRLLRLPLARLNKPIDEAVSALSRPFPSVAPRACATSKRLTAR